MEKAALKTECMALKASGVDVKISKASDTPLPITISFVIPQPDTATQYDIFELFIQLVVASFDPLSISIKVDEKTNGLPLALAKNMEKMVRLV